ncbi:MAG: hypothetical protein ACYC6M_08435 [Terriglobales bacterium]
MKMLALFLLPAGWAIALAAAVLLPATRPAAFALFCAAGLGLQVMGVGLLLRAHAWQGAPR